MKHAVRIVLGLAIMAAMIRPHLACAKGLDLSNERDVARVVDAYVEMNGDTFAEYHFSRRSAIDAVMFFPRLCRLTKGEFAGVPFVLSDWQALDIIIPAFGWKCEDGTRRYRRATIWVPRKNGKTELMAGVSLMHLVGDGEMGGEGYAVATKEEQARIVFDAARRMVLMNDDLRQHLQVFKDSIYCESLFSVFRPLGGNAEGTHGKGPSFRIADELHEFKDDRILQFLDQGTGARQQPMGWDISTAGLQQGFGWELWNATRKLREGILVDHRTLVAVYAADETDDPYDPETWAKANPNLGISLKLEYMRDQAELAKRSARYENDFKRYHLNLWVGQIRRWLKMDRWLACSADRTDALAWKRAFDELRGRRCFIGVDLASVSDLCSEVLVFPPASSDEKWRVLVRIFLPREGLDERVRHEMAPYDEWAVSGAVTLTEGDCADHEVIQRQIIEDIEVYDVQGIGFDPWNAHKMMVEINAIYPDLAAKVSQSMAGLSGASKLLERLVMTMALDHGNHPVLTVQADNVTVLSDANANIRPDRKKSTQKIDAIVALVIALARSDGDTADAGIPSLEMVTL